MEETSGRVSKTTGLREKTFFISREENVLLISSKVPPKLCNVSETRSTSNGGDASEG